MTLRLESAAAMPGEQALASCWMQMEPPTQKANITTQTSVSLHHNFNEECIDYKCFYGIDAIMVLDHFRIFRIIVVNQLR